MKRYSLPIILASTLLAQAASARHFSSTPVIGYYKFDAPAGTTAWNCAFVTKKDFQGAATSITSGTPNSTINVSGTPFTAGAFSLHYVEILSGANAGLILDVVSNTTSSIVVQGTTAGFGLTGTETFCVRKHATISTVFPGGGGLNAFADLVTMIDSSGAEIVLGYDGSGWVDGGDFSTPKPNEIIYPGQGFLISASGLTTITFGGGEVSYVKTGPTKIPVYANVQNLVGVLNPLVGSAPADVTSINSLGLFALLDPFAEIATKPSIDGLFADFAVYGSDGSSLVSATDFTTPLPPGESLPNGSAFGISVGADKLYTQPQLIP